VEVFDEVLKKQRACCYMARINCRHRSRVDFILTLIQLRHRRSDPD
jgi:hypothetical protein